MSGQDRANARRLTWDEFAAAYNDHDTHPTLADVAVALGVSFQTVRNKGVILAKLQGRPGVPAMRNRREAYLAATRAPSIAPSLEDMLPERTPKDHAHARADGLRRTLGGLFASSRWPIANPEAVIVEPRLTSTYSRRAGEYRDRESTPAVRLADTLRVEPIIDVRGRSFILSSAQNDTPVDAPFWRSLTTYARWLDADVAIGPLTYETQWWDEANPASRAYDSLLEPHLCFGQLALGDALVFCGEMNTLPTASNPVTDLVTYPRGRWGVFPHPKVQLTSVVSTDPDAQAVQVMTTGSVTRPKVVPRKAGVKSLFHHQLAAVLVEFDDAGRVFCRHLTADADGGFYDLDRYVSGDSITYGHRARAFVAADLHTAKVGAPVVAATFGIDLESSEPVPGSLMERLAPDFVFLHDAHDQESRNHHAVGDAAHAYLTALRQRDSVEEEVRRAADLVAAIAARGPKVVVVESNHDIALERYVREGRHRGDGINYRYGLELEAAYMNARELQALAIDCGRRPEPFSLLEHAMRALRPNGLEAVEFAYDGGSFVLDGIECGHHGFRGANGSKGTHTGFARFGRKMTYGDKHSPSVIEGAWGVGAMALHQGYNRGPSSWAVAHVVHYPNGTRAMITMQDGRWAANQDENHGQLSPSDPSRAGRARPAVDPERDGPADAAARDAPPGRIVPGGRGRDEQAPVGLRRRDVAQHGSRLR